MTIDTGLSAQTRRPLTSHKFTYSLAVPGLASLPLRVALIGAKSSTGTAVAGTVYECTDAVQTDALFGVGSEIALMCRMAFATQAFLGRGPKVFAVCIAEPGGVLPLLQLVAGFAHHRANDR